MHILMTGATGQLGRFIAHGLLKEGHELTFLGSTRPDNSSISFVEWDLANSDMVLPSADALIHCALSHEPGKYRGGEGDDPQKFWTLNAEGTERLFNAAKAAGIKHCVFLSSRAVYTDNNRWEVLTEETETKPESLYGVVKLAGEIALENLCDEAFAGTVLRATGVYGVPPGAARHKWSDLFAAFENGEDIPPRIGTEVHGEDLAAAVSLVLKRVHSQTADLEFYNVSDLLLDRHDLLKLHASVSGVSQQLPARAEGPVGVMEAGKLKVLGWNPGGKARLNAFLMDVAMKQAGRPH